MALVKHPHPTPTPHDSPTQYDTSDAEDVRALAAAILAIIQTSEFDDMSWREVDAALRLAAHHTRLNWIATSTVKPAPPPAP